MENLADEWALRRLVLLYARAVDRNDPDLFVSLFLEDTVLEGPGFHVAGLEEIRGVPGSLAQKFHGTMHCVFNQTVTIDQPWTDFRGERHERMVGRPISFHAMRGISAHSNGFQTARALHVPYQKRGLQD